MKFPNNRHLERGFRVSRLARNLIWRLLQECDDRLCSPKYSVNDPRRKVSDDSTNSTWGESACRESRGHFVYSDDAADIKAHPFFRNVEWQQLHLMKPPEVPKVSSFSDTRYFEQEGSLSDVEDASSSATFWERQMLAQEHFEHDVVRVYKENLAQAEVADQLDGLRVLDDAMEIERLKKNAAEILGGALLDPARTKMGMRQKETKRPRDRILRDLSVAGEALELRKAGAFVGYTYRRPRELLARLRRQAEYPSCENAER